MFDSPLNIFLFVALIVAAFIVTAMFLGLVREECPSKYKEIRGPNELFASALGPFHLGLTYILPLDYESWDLSRKAIWLGRGLFAINVSYLVVIVWVLISLLHLQ